MKVYIVTGTAGTGKTVLAKKISKEKKAEYINGNQIVKKYNLSVGYDNKRKCEIIDEDKFCDKLKEIISNSKKNLVIDSLLSHYLDPKYVDKCFVTKCNIKELRKRLKERKYSKEKIEENIEAEIMDVCYNEALKKGHNVEVVWTSENLDMRDYPIN